MTFVHDNLETVFQRYADRPFLLVRPGGNWGDELIYWGARTLADRLAIEWREIGEDELATCSLDPSTVVYIHGGGGFNPFSSGRVAKVLRYVVSHHTGVVIQGPQTFIEDVEALGSMTAGLFDQPTVEDLVIFAREEPSLAAIRSVFPHHISIGIDEDTAFHIDRTDVERRIGTMRRRYDLMATRQDREGGGLEPPGPRQAVTIDPAYFATNFDHWLRVHAAANRIVTNRTHSSILGAILEIPTTLYAGRYHKNRSIWEYSLQRRGVSWLEDGSLQRPEVAVRLRAGGVVGRIENSWKVQRFGKWLQGVPLS